MNKKVFLEQQFLSLREEIKESKSRQFKIFGFAIALIPAGQYLSKTIGICQGRRENVPVVAV